MRYLTLKYRSLTFLIALLSIAGYDANAQREADHWYFGDGCNVHFTQSGVVSDTLRGTLNQMEGVTSFSHPITGELLSYSDGVESWSADHSRMPNGFGMLGHQSSSQSSLIIPVPGDRNRLYLFSLDDGQINNGRNGLSYSIIDTRMNSQLGDIHPARKNVTVFKPSGERMVATRHANGNSYWLMVQGFLSNDYYAFEISPTGISAPVKSTLGPNNRSGVSVGGVEIGCMKFSVQGDQLAVALTGQDAVTLMDFDNSTGRLSNARTQSTLLPYGLEFSPNGRLLYVSSHRKIMQFLTGPLFTRAGLKVYEANLTVFTALQLGKDQKIYVAPLYTKFLSVIREPDKPGMACSFDFRGHQLNQNSTCLSGLPNIVSSFMSPHQFDVRNNCEKQYTVVGLKNPSYYDSVLFDFGDPSSGSLNYSRNKLDSHLYRTPGKYVIKAMIYSSFHHKFIRDTLIDTIEIQRIPLVELGKDTSFCRGPLFTIDAGGDGDWYEWNDGVKTRRRWIRNTGLYRVDVSNICGTGTDSIYVRVDDSLSILLGPDTSFCSGDTVALYSLTEGNHYRWNTGDTGRFINVSIGGSYWVEVTNSCNTSKDSVDAIEIEFPVNYFSRDTVLCKGDTAVIGNTANATSFRWNNGETTPQIKVYRSGFYMVRAANRCGVDYDSIFVYFDELPENPFSDTVLCVGDTMWRTARVPYSTKYRWSDGSSDSTIMITQPGEYQLVITNVCGQGIETFEVASQTLEQDSLTRTIYLCEGQRKLLTTGLSKDVLKYTDVVWQGKRDKEEYFVKSPGVYYFKAQNACGMIEDTIEVKFSDKPDYEFERTYQLCHDPVHFDLQDSEYQFTWPDGDTSRIKDIDEAGTFEVQVSNSAGCQVFREFEIHHCAAPMFIPTAFTPNMDGDNDFFEVEVERMAEFEITVVDRWNNLLFQSTDVNFKWDGRAKNGEFVQVGTYVYRIVYRSTDSEQIRIREGEITIIR